MTLALAVGGCGTQWWKLIPMDAGAAPETDAGRSDVVPDAPGGDTPLSYGHCNSDSDCVELGWRCDPRMLLCVQCVDDTDCKDPTASRCDTRNTCVYCRSSPVDTCGPGMRCDVTDCFYSCADGGGCPAVAPFCNISRLVCASCLTNDDCADASVPSFCETTSGTCMESDIVVTQPPISDASSTFEAGDAAAETASVEDAAEGDGGGE